MSRAPPWEGCSGRTAEIRISLLHDVGSRELFTLIVYALVYFSLVC